MYCTAGKQILLINVYYGVLKVIKQSDFKATKASVLMVYSDSLRQVMSFCPAVSKPSSRTVKSDSNQAVSEQPTTDI